MPQLNNRYFPAVDGLRAICVAMVMLNHIADVPVRLGQAPSWLGVDIFFLISGFIITTLLFREEDETGKIDLYAFYVRRLFRIVPLYLAILGGYFLASVRNPARLHLLLHYAGYYLTFCGEFIKLLPYNPAAVPPFGATWTLGIEEKFYLIWPVAFFFLAPRKWRAVVIPILILLVLPLDKFWMTRSYVGLLLGCVIALLLRSRRFQGYSTAVRRTPVAVFVALAMAAFYLVGMNWHFVFFFDVVGMLLLSSMLLSDSWLVSFLSLRPVVWLGRRSYSMYLLHTFSLDVMEHLVHGGSYVRTFVILVGGMAIAAVGATVTYRFIEEPCRIYGKHLLARKGHNASSISPAAVKAEGGV